MIVELLADNEALMENDKNNPNKWKFSDAALELLKIKKGEIAYIAFAEVQCREGVNARFYSNIIINYTEQLKHCQSISSKYFAKVFKNGTFTSKHYTYLLFKGSKNKLKLVGCDIEPLCLPKVLLV